MRFVWDARKAAGNVKKQGVSFEEASTALADDHALAGADPDHSEGESRWVTFGVTDRGRLVVVSHTEDGDIIRIISARPATRSERKLYEEG